MRYVTRIMGGGDKDNDQIELESQEMRPNDFEIDISFREID